MLKKKSIIIVGAGPGGLCAGMLLAHQGHDVHIYEKNSDVGGRNGAIQIDGYTFDIGPTFFMLPQILDEMFERTGRKVGDYLDMKSLDPLYRLSFQGKGDLLVTSDHDEMERRIEELFPGDGKNYRKFLAREKKKFDLVFPCLRVPYQRPWHYLRARLLKALPKLDALKSVYSIVSKYFMHEEMRYAMTFQSKYLGMSPWECPGTFTILPYIEHTFGIHHPIGGLNQISHAMAKVFTEEGGHLHLQKTVQKISTKNGKATGVVLEDGSTHEADIVVINADFAHAMQTLLEEKDRPHYTDAKLEKKGYSCSTFMLYLGVKKQFDLPHHSILFAKDYKKNVEEIVSGAPLGEDFSLYVQNASATDPTLAPEGCSTLYVLVPVANQRSGISWEEEKMRLREKVLDAMETRGGFAGVREVIEIEKIITPADWEKDVYNGAVFNLAHTLSQMLYFRPHNQFEDLKNCYLVGGGTHPGSGLPTILESGKICADMIK